METPSESSPATAAADQLIQELRPQVNAIVKMAELLKTNAASDENVEQIIIAARGLLDVVSRPSAPSLDDNDGRSEPSEQYDVLYIEDDPIPFASVKLLLKTQRAL